MLREPGLAGDLFALRDRASDLVRRHRRSAAALLAAAAVVLGVSAARPKPPASTSVWVAARDLPGGAPLTADDIRAERLPEADVPDGALPADRRPVGLVLGAPVRRGEPLTDLRILTINLVSASGGAGDLAVVVRVTDAPATLALVKPGEWISVIAAGDPEAGVIGHAHVVVEDVRVLAVPHAPTDGGGLVVVAATARQAKAIAAIGTGARVSVAVRH